MKPAIILAAIWAAAPNATSAQQRVAVNLNTHSRVEIERPATAIWPHVLDPNKWKQGLPIAHHSGPAGKVGEVFAATDPANPGAVAFFAENVELVPNQRRTIKLYEPGGKLVGYATWTLENNKGGTVVGYDVYSETLLPADQAGRLTGEALAAQEREGYESNKKRFDAELVALKRLVEAR